MEMEHTRLDEGEQGSDRPPKIGHLPHLAKQETINQYEHISHEKHANDTSSKTCLSLDLPVERDGVQGLKHYYDKACHDHYPVHAIHTRNDYY